MDPANLEATQSNPTISSLANICTSIFLRRIDRSHHGDWEAIEDAQGRFNVWAANVGALQPPESRNSLDFRLKDAELMRTSVISGLKRLESVQARITGILNGEQPNRVPTEGILEQANPETKEPVLDELNELYLNMKTSIDHLFGLSMLIRRLRPRGKFHQFSTSQSSIDPPRDIVAIIDKFPKARQTPWLAEKLATANDQRRQFFAYRQQHRENLGNISKGKEVSSVDNTVTLGAATTVATTFEEGDDGTFEAKDIPLNRMSNFTTATSFVSDFDDSGQMGRHIPDLPAMTLDGMPLGYDGSIECPYCRTIQSFTDRLMWKEHVFYDLQPYLCTFEDCSVPPFSTRSEWFQHELDSHRRRWECILCNNPRPTFSRRAQIAAHFKEHHEGTVTENQTDLILGACETSMTKFDASACPLCSEWVPPLEEAINLRDFRRHLARHLQQISSEALPLYIEGLAIQEDPSQDETVVCKKGVVLIDFYNFFDGRDSRATCVERGEEVLILDDMFDENLWNIRVMMNGKDCQIPGSWIQVIGSTTISLGGASEYCRKNKSWDGLLDNMLPEPDPSKLRMWTTSSGSFRAPAQFIGVVENKILLLKSNGVQIRVGRERLSAQDLAYVDNIAELQFDSEDDSEDHTDSERTDTD